MIKLTDLLEDQSVQDADKWVQFLQSKLDLENLKKEFGASNVRADIDYATDYFNVIDSIANQEIE